MELPALTDDLVDEVLLRFPPGEPERLVRAALVCKRWFRLIADPRFRRRFRELHRAAPMLGFFCTDYSTSRFVPTGSFPPPHAIPGDWRAIDARHGRVVLNTGRPWNYSFYCWGDELVVWDPVTDERHRLPKMPDHMYPSPYPYCCHWTAAVLCAAAAAEGGGCDHLDCRGGSFLVVFACTSSREAFASVSSSEARAWSGPATLRLRRSGVSLSAPSALVGNELYFMSDRNRRRNGVLKHVLGTQEISLIRLPRTPYTRIALMTTADGRLGFAGVRELKIHLWSRVSGNEGYAGWAQYRAIDLETLVRPAGTLPAWLFVVCFVDGVAGIFKGPNEDGRKPAIFTIDLKSGQTRKALEGHVSYAVVPYMSFYTPALRGASTGDPNQEHTLQVAHENSQC